MHLCLHHACALLANAAHSLINEFTNIRDRLASTHEFLEVMQYAVHGTEGARAADTSTAVHHNGSWTAIVAIALPLLFELCTELVDLQRRELSQTIAPSERRSAHQMYALSKALRASSGQPKVWPRRVLHMEQRTTRLIGSSLEAQLANLDVVRCRFLGKQRYSKATKLGKFLALVRIVSRAFGLMGEKRENT